MEKKQLYKEIEKNQKTGNYDNLIDNLYILAKNYGETKPLIALCGKYIVEYDLSRQKEFEKCLEYTAEIDKDIRSLYIHCLLTGSYNFEKNCKKAIDTCIEASKKGDTEVFDALVESILENEFPDMNSIDKMNCLEKANEYYKSEKNPNPKTRKIKEKVEREININKLTKFYQLMAVGGIKNPTENVDKTTPREPALD